MKLRVRGFVGTFSKGKESPQKVSPLRLLVKSRREDAKNTATTSLLFLLPLLIRRSLPWRQPAAKYSKDELQTGDAKEQLELDRRGYWGMAPHPLKAAL